MHRKWTWTGQNLEVNSHISNHSPLTALVEHHKTEGREWPRKVMHENWIEKNECICSCWNGLGVLNITLPSNGGSWIEGGPMLLRCCFALSSSSLQAWEAGCSTPWDSTRSNVWWWPPVPGPPGRQGTKGHVLPTPQRGSGEGPGRIPCSGLCSCLLRRQRRAVYWPAGPGSARSVLAPGQAEASSAGGPPTAAPGPFPLRCPRCSPHPPQWPPPPTRGRRDPAFGRETWPRSRPGGPRVLPTVTPQTPPRGLWSPGGSLRFSRGNSFLCSFPLHRSPPSVLGAALAFYRM